MRFKTLLGIALTAVIITFAIGYFGVSSSIAGLTNIHFPWDSATTTTKIAPAPSVAVIPPANPDRTDFTIPKIVFPKIPIRIDPPTPAPATPAPVQATSSTPNLEIKVTSIATTSPKTSVVQEGFPKGAFVNIICSPSKRSAFQKSISGSGVIIDPRGIILTVAHVGHYFLLEDYPKDRNADCVIRAGEPAKTAYDAKLIYVSPEWVKENASALAKTAPRGTGENDFALLAITESLTSKRLPEVFPYVPLSSATTKPKDVVSIGSYGAEFLTGAEIRSELYPTFTEGSVADVYTFGNKNEIDVLSVKGTIAAQSGSSGGGLADLRNRFVGLITTSSLTGGANDRTLYAITPTHLRASFKKDTGEDLDTYMEQDLDELVNNFEDEITPLARIVWNAIF